VIESGGWCFVITSDYMCPFVQDDKCVVYDHRPKVCKLFGRVKEAPCAYFTYQGNPRTVKETERVKAEWAEKRLKMQMLGKSAK